MFVWTRTPSRGRLWFYGRTEFSPLETSKNGSFAVLGYVSGTRYIHRECASMPCTPFARHTIGRKSQSERESCVSDALQEGTDHYQTSTIGRKPPSSREETLLPAADRDVVPSLKPSGRPSLVSFHEEQDKKLNSAREASTFTSEGFNVDFEVAVGRSGVAWSPPWSPP